MNSHTPTIAQPGTQNRLVQASALVVVAAGIVLAVKGQRLLDIAAPYGYFYWAQGGVRALIGGSFIAAGLLFIRPATPTSPLPRALTWTLLGLLLAAAFALRAFHLDSAPPGLFYDEASNMHEAMRIAERGQYYVYSPANNGNPALYFYQMAALFKLFGVTTTAARMTSALSGVLAVLVLFLLGRRMYDEKVALLAAGLLAISRWHISFSRIAFSGIQATLWPALALLLLWIALQLPGRGEPRPPGWHGHSWPWIGLAWHAAAGIALALCLYAYTAAQVVLGVAGVLLLALAARHPRRLWERRWGLAAMAAAFALALLPLALYMRAHPEDFNQRAQQVWLFSGVPEGERGHVLADNVRRTLLQLDFAGDGNARHNLPYRRMLDFASAALAPAAVLWALANLTQSAPAACLLWFLLGLLPGILSVEAPHALRTLVVLPPLCLLLASLLRRMGAALATFLPRRLVWTPALALLLWAWLGYTETRLYLGAQTHSRQAWDDFESTATLAARSLRRLAAESSDLHCNIAGSLSLTMELWQDRLPIQLARRPSDLLQVDASRRQVFVYALTGGEGDVAAHIARFFPHASVQTVADPLGRPALVVAILTPEDYARNRGLHAVYAAGDRRLERVETGASLLQRGAEGFALPAPFAVQWTGMLVLPQTITACFRLRAHGAAELSIDAQPVASATSVRLCAGLHALAARYTPEGAPSLSLTWDAGAGGPPDAPLPDSVLVAHAFPRRGFLQRLYDRPDWQGEPDGQDVVEGIDFEWVDVPGDSRLFSVQWRGTLTAPHSGVYTFTTQAQDHSMVEVDGATLVERREQARLAASAGVYLPAGTYALEVKYSDSLGFSFMRLYWQPPGAGREILPGKYVEPAW